MGTRLTTEEFVYRAIKKHKNKYGYNSVAYIDNQTNVKIWCNKCERYFWQRPAVHTSGGECSRCKGNHVPTTKEFIRKATKIHKGKYGYNKTNYINSKIKIEIWCKKCEKYFLQSPKIHLEGKGCKQCWELRRSHTKEFFVSRAIIKHMNFYKYHAVKYINNYTKVKIECPDHGYFNQEPNAHLAGRGCPKCKQSGGEKSVELFLTNNNIRFEFQKKFINLRSPKNRPLSYDFFLPDYKVLIEYDGEFHCNLEIYCRLKHIKGEKQLVENYYYMKYLDKLKTQYAKKNGYKLIRIPFHKKDQIDEILNKELGAKIN